MSRTATLTFIVPELRHGPANIADAGEGRWPQLARLAGRGHVSHVDRDRTRDLRPWQSVLLKAASLDASATGHASAPLSRLADSDTTPAGFWMHAEPVHLAAGLDHLSLVALVGEAEVSEDERASLRMTLEAHLDTCGFTLHESSRGTWLVATTNTLRVSTVHPEAALGDLDAALPRGEDATGLRRTMTELQMLLHEHPINEARTRRGLPTVNCLWFWGGGSLERVAPRSLPAGFGDEVYLRGLYRLYGASITALPATVDGLLERLPPRGPAVCVASLDSLDALEERWMAGLATALIGGRYARLELVLGGWLLSADRLAMLRFWRRPCPPTQWVA